MGDVLGVLLPALALIAPGFVHDGICPDGRYLLMQLRRPEPPQIVIEGSLVSIDGICPPVAAEIGTSPDGTNVRVEWPACELPFRGRMRLRAVIDRTCTRLTGAIRRPATTRRFRAGRFPACGNGVVESYERCDDHNTADGDCCSATCGREYDPSCPGGCRMDADCAPDAYCATAFDCCDGGGVCIARPVACTDLYTPQCGCDENLYVNRCAAAAGVNLLDLLHCDRPCGTISGIECPAGQFCDLPERSCGGADLGGTCAIVPTLCPRNVDPVCGCNGVTYPNDCVRARSGYRRHTRAAAPVDPVSSHLTSAVGVENPRRDGRRRPPYLAERVWALDAPRELGMGVRHRRLWRGDLHRAQF